MRRCRGERGARFDAGALLSGPSTLARVPLLLLALLLVRGLPALLYAGEIGARDARIAGLLQATSLPFIVAATMIGQQSGVISKPTSAAFIAAGLLSVVLFPATGLALLRRGGRAPGGAISQASPVLSAEDRLLCRAAASGPGTAA